MNIINIRIVVLWQIKKKYQVRICATKERNKGTKRDRTLKLLTDIEATNNEGMDCRI